MTCVFRGRPRGCWCFVLSVRWCSSSVFWCLLRVYWWCCRRTPCAPCPPPQQRLSDVPVPPAPRPPSTRPPPPPTSPNNKRPFRATTAAALPPFARHAGQPRADPDREAAATQFIAGAGPRLEAVVIEALEAEVTAHIPLDHRCALLYHCSGTM